MLLEIRNLSVEFGTGARPVRAVDGVSFSIMPGQSLGLVGESGCGKSTTAYSIMRLLSNPGRIVSGEVLFNGTDLVTLPESQLRRIRWKEMSMVFQNSMTALNPVLKIGDQIVDALILHRDISRPEAVDRGAKLFEQVGLAPSRLFQYPHEFSGGMKQRALIALALACGPKLILADEPTTALDVVAQRQVLELLMHLQVEFGLALLMISHDISAVAETCTHVAVMYAGQIVEMGESRTVFLKGRHPYTRALVNSFPSIHAPLRTLDSIKGAPPDLSEPLTGCRFAPRCWRSEAICFESSPLEVEIGLGHTAWCHFATEDTGPLKVDQ